MDLGEEDTYGKAGRAAVAWARAPQLSAGAYPAPARRHAMVGEADPDHPDAKSGQFDRSYKVSLS